MYVDNLSSYTSIYILWLTWCHPLLGWGKGLVGIAKGPCLTGRCDAPSSRITPLRMTFITMINPGGMALNPSNTTIGMVFSSTINPVGQAFSTILHPGGIALSIIFNPWRIALSITITPGGMAFNWTFQIVRNSIQHHNMLRGMTFTLLSTQ